MLAAHGAERVLVVASTCAAGASPPHGWTASQRAEHRARCSSACTPRGVRDFVYTNVDRDGMLDGPDLEEVAAVAAAVAGSFVYSGGIGALETCEGARALCARPSLAGVIVGKALYEGASRSRRRSTALGD